MNANGIPPQRAPEPPGPAAERGFDALAWAVSSGTAEAVIDNLNRKARRRRRWTAGAAAAVTLIVTGLMWPRVERIRPAGMPAGPSASVSLPAKRILSDGTTVALRHGAEVAVEFSATQRRVVLVRGEAHFDVASNPSWPFVVAAGAGLEVRAVGTAFSVARDEARVDVLVTEGRVRIDKPASGAAANAGSAGQAVAPAMETIVALEAGKRVSIATIVAPGAGMPEVFDVSEDERDRRLAWRVPRLEFSGTPLREAIAMFRQYGGVRLTLDPALAELQMSGALSADDVDSFLLLLKHEFGIAAQTRADGTIALHRP